MENLEYLLEEKKDLKGRIKEGLDSLTSWFEGKQSEAKNFFTRIKEKVSGKKVDKGILTRLQAVCDSIVVACKNGLKAIKLKDAKKALSFKEVVLKKFESAKGLVRSLGSKIKKNEEYYEEDFDLLDEASALLDEEDDMGFLFEGCKKKAKKKACRKEEDEDCDDDEECDDLYEEDFDFNSLMEEVDSIGEDNEVFEEEADFESLLEELEVANSNYEDEEFNSLLEGFEENTFEEEPEVFDEDVKFEQLLDELRNL